MTRDGYQESQQPPLYSPYLHFHAIKAQPVGIRRDWVRDGVSWSPSILRSYTQAYSPQELPCPLPSMLTSVLPSRAHKHRGYI